MGDSSLPRTIHDVATPCFLVDIGKVKRNAQAMIDRCKKLGVQLRPHVKTHKCLEIGEISTGYTKRGIVVSTLSEAEMFADGGFDDIIFAQLFTQDKLLRMSRLAARLDIFHVIVDNEVSVQLLEDNPLTNSKWSVLVKVDCGGSRAGVPWDGDTAITLAKRLSHNTACTFRGIYCHEGQSYKAKGFDEVEQVSSQTAERILDVANRIRSAGVECLSVSVGSTPTASRPSEIMKDLTELHPGNYLFYDAQQCMIGSCQIENVAVRLATRIIGQYPHRNQLLVDAGWTALSLEGHGAIPNGSYCLVEDHPLLTLVKMTQEVGFVQPSRGKLNFDEYPIGKLLFLIPYHSCATACMHSEYLIHEGDKVVDVYKPCRGW